MPQAEAERAAGHRERAEILHYHRGGEAGESEDIMGGGGGRGGDLHDVGSESRYRDGTPIIIVSASGRGARADGRRIDLMQLAKILTALSQPGFARVPLPSQLWYPIPTTRRHDPAVVRGWEREI